MNGNKAYDFATQERTAEQINNEVHRLRKRLENLEDLRDLKRAVKPNGDMPLIPIANLKKYIDID